MIIDISIICSDFVALITVLCDIFFSSKVLKLCKNFDRSVIKIHLLRFRYLYPEIYHPLFVMIKDDTFEAFYLMHLLQNANNSYPKHSDQVGSPLKITYRMSFNYKAF